MASGKGRHYILYYYYVLLLAFSILPRLVYVTPIVGGELVRTVGEVPKYPYMVSLQDRIISSNRTVEYQHFCGGTLISSRWILTAAHCIWRKQIDQIVAVIGQENISKYMQFRYYNIDDVEFILFQPTNFQNDIALLRLVEPFQKNNTAKLENSINNFANLPGYGMKAYRKIPCKIIGYGATQHAGATQNHLRKGEVRVISKKQCQHLLGRIWAPQVGDNTVCALGENEDSCQGDSGGPLICSYDGQDYIYGIVSHGLTCGVTGVPSIYTVTIPYMEWIDLVINN